MSGLSRLGQVMLGHDRLEQDMSGIYRLVQVRQVLANLGQV
jgi:hypothetical protein